MSTLYRKTGMAAGFSILEVLFATSLIALVIGLSATTILGSQKILYRIKKVNRTIVTGNTVRSEIQRALFTVDSYPFPSTLRTHTGTIRYTDGSVNPIAYSSKRPLPSSSAITALELNLLALQKTRFLGTNLPDYTLCPFGDPLSGSRFVLAAFTATGIAESEGTALGAADSSGCRTVRITQVRSMSLHGPFPDKDIEFVAPIRNHFTLYVDQSNTLRYLSHLGPQNIENQPIWSGIQLLHISLSHLLSNKLTQIKVAVMPVSGSQQEFSLVHRLGRVSYTDFFSTLLENQQGGGNG